MDLDHNFYRHLFSSYSHFKCDKISGRYLPETVINSINHKLSRHLKITNEGNSALSRVISSYTIGNGPIRILIWSQMHGNESTSTKAIYDLLNLQCFHSKDYEGINDLLEKVTLKIIPVLNLDGAFAYTRKNANNIDLNRDALEQSQPETQLLFSIIETFKPNVCFNMHGQRTIFEAEPNQTATLSFLSAAYNKDREVNPCRIRSMQIINAIHHLLSDYIPGKIGRYDDQFNINCTGDYLHAQNIPTVLFESGHYPDDYEREKVRVFTFLALLKAVDAVANTRNDATLDQQLVCRKYLSIPENKKTFVDILIQNAIINGGIKDIEVLYREDLEDNKIIFTPVVNKILKQSNKLGHKVIKTDSNNEFDELEVGSRLAKF